MPSSSSHHRLPSETDLREHVERVLELIREYPRGPRTRERLHRTSRALNELTDALASAAPVARRPYLEPARSGTVVTNPAVEFWVIADYEGDVVDRIGVLYQFATDGESVRFGVAYYAPDDADEDDGTVMNPGEARWRDRLRAPLATLTSAGFQTDEGGREQRIAAVEKWDAGWLAWRSYERGAVPDADVLLQDLGAALVAYDAILDDEEFSV
jgi:hypothetical protein